MLTECPLESYGQDCVYNCSGNCLGEVACNRTTGKCDTGCDFGYTGDLCETGLMKLKRLKYAFIVVDFNCLKEKCDTQLYDYAKNRIKDYYSRIFWFDNFDNKQVCF